MSICFAAHFLRKDGWGGASIEYLRALSTATEDIVAIDVDTHGPIGTSNSRRELPEDLARFFNRKIDNTEVLIQMSLPQSYYRDNRFKKNVGIVFTEAQHDHTNYRFRRMNYLLDNVIVPNSYDVSDHMDRWSIVPLPCDHTKYTKHYPDTSLSFKEDRATKMFYTIAEDYPRKNIREMILAYFESFSSRDNVVFVIKTNKNISHHYEWAKEHLSTKSVNIIPKIIIIDRELTSEEILSLHQAGDIYVCASFGESWCYPMFDAAAMNNYVLSSVKVDYLHGSPNLIHIPSRQGPCSISQKQLPFYYTMRDTVNLVTIGDISSGMLAAYSAVSDKVRKSAGLLSVEDFSYKNIGRQLKKCLEY